MAIKDHIKVKKISISFSAKFSPSGDPEQTKRTSLVQRLVILMLTFKQSVNLQTKLINKMPVFAHLSEMLNYLRWGATV